MENKLVVGILNIVENKLREFGIQIPDADREDSTDPIVGYQYAELHDQIQEYLEEAGVFEDKSIELYGISVVNSAGYWGGNESQVDIFVSLQDSLDFAYKKYLHTWEEAREADVPDLPSKMPKKIFETQMIQFGSVCVKFDDFHVNIERFAQEIVFLPQRTSSLDTIIQSAAKTKHNNQVIYTLSKEQNEPVR